MQDGGPDPIWDARRGSGDGAWWGPAGLPRGRGGEVGQGAEPSHRVDSGRGRSRPAPPAKLWERAQRSAFILSALGATERL